MTRKRYLYLLALALLGLGWAGPAQATSMITYGVTVDTSSLYGQTGSNAGLDFQFNPSGSPVSDVLTATVSNFTTDGALVGSTQPTGDASGSLPGNLTIKDSTGYNDAFQNFTFGDTLSFDVTLSGNLTNPNPGAEFSLTLYDQNNSPALSAPGEFQNFVVDIYPDGTLTVTTSDPYTATPETGGIASSPEPSSMVLLSACMVGLGGCWLWRKRRASLVALAAH